jgi:hypothetical protein
MWYYELKGQKHGPVDQDTIISLFHNGVIYGSTRVCKNGEQEWMNLSETDLYKLFGNVVFTEEPARKVNPHRIKLSALKALFVWWVVLFCVSLLFPFINILLISNSMTNLAAGMICVFIPAIIAYTVLDYLLLYKYWQINQDGYSLTTPGKAVGFLFIPLFNIFWVFISFGGLAGDQNRFIARNFNEDIRKNVRKAHPPIWIVFIVLTIIFSLVFTLGLSTIEKPLIIFNSILLVASLVIQILRFLMFTDFYMTANSILKNEVGLSLTSI